MEFSISLLVQIKWGEKHLPHLKLINSVCVHDREGAGGKLILI